MSYEPSTSEQAVYTWLASLVTEPEPVPPIPIIYEHQDGVRPRGAFVSLLILDDVPIGEASEQTSAAGTQQLAHERLLDVRITIYGRTARAIAQQILTRAELTASAALARSLGIAVRRLRAARVPTVLSQITEDRWVLTTQAQYVAATERAEQLVSSITPTYTALTGD